MIQEENIIKYEEPTRLFFGLIPWKFHRYLIGTQSITEINGLLITKEDECYLYKITDVRLETSFIERLVGLNTVICISGDATSPVLILRHIKNGREIKDFIFKNSEQERLNRRTVNMVDL